MLLIALDQVRLPNHSLFIALDQIRYAYTPHVFMISQKIISGRFFFLLEKIDTIALVIREERLSRSYPVCNSLYEPMRNVHTTVKPRASLGQKRRSLTAVAYCIVPGTYFTIFFVRYLAHPWDCASLCIGPIFYMMEPRSRFRDKSLGIRVIL